MSEKTNTPSGRRSKKAQEPEQEKTLRIEVSKFKSVIDALSGDKWWRIMFSVFFAGCLLFTGIATVALAIKRMYPYSDITTNGLGATTIKSEKSEVSYWLYNTAILWADSGISVEEGDIITIRSSGKFNTAIHHLYDSAKENKEMQDEWIGPEGVQDDPVNHNGSYERRQYRIFPSLPTGALVMQVVRNNPFDSPNDGDAREENFYFIGGERENIYINNPGTLYFSLNDIVFNDVTIRNLLDESVKDVYSKDPTKALELKALKNESDSVAIKKLFNAYYDAYKTDFDYLNKGYKKDFVLEHVPMGILKGKDYDGIIKALSASLDYHMVFPDRIIEKVNAFVSANNYKGVEQEKKDKGVERAYNDLVNELSANRAIGKMRLGVTRVGDNKVISELEQYYKKGEDGKRYKTAWFDDNVGSFLIVVEKKTR